MVLLYRARTGFTYINRAKVENELKTTKTKAGIRKILMFPKAREALMNQLEFTKDCEYVFIIQTPIKNGLIAQK